MYLLPHTHLETEAIFVQFVFWSPSLHSPAKRHIHSFDYNIFHV